MAMCRPRYQVRVLDRWFMLATIIAPFTVFLNAQAADYDGSLYYFHPFCVPEDAPNIKVNKYRGILDPAFDGVIGKKLELECDYGYNTTATKVRFGVWICVDQTEYNQTAAEDYEFQKTIFEFYPHEPEREPRVFNLWIMNETWINLTADTRKVLTSYSFVRYPRHVSVLSVYPVPTGLQHAMFYCQVWHQGCRESQRSDWSDQIKLTRPHILYVSLHRGLIDQRHIWPGSYVNLKDVIICKSYAMPAVDIMEFRGTALLGNRTGQPTCRWDHGLQQVLCYHKAIVARVGSVYCEASHHSDPPVSMCLYNNCNRTFSLFFTTEEIRYARPIWSGMGKMSASLFLQFTIVACFYIMSNEIN